MEARHEPILTRSADRVELPDEFTPRRLGRRALPVLVLIAVAAAILAFAPGLGEVRDRFRGADPAWLALGVGLEALSCVSYVVLFRPVFCARMSWRTSWEISWAELGVGSLVPASGAAGVALGAGGVHRGGMPPQHVARRPVALLGVKNSVDFAAGAGIGPGLGAGLVGAPPPPPPAPPAPAP